MYAHGKAEGKQRLQRAAGQQQQQQQRQQYLEQVHNNAFVSLQVVLPSDG